MLIGAYGRFWDRDLVDFDARGWRLLGRVGQNRGTIQVVDFRRARGVYVLYNEVGVYYVGLASGREGIGRRLKDHLSDEHGDGWTRFSWFVFDMPSQEQYEDGVFKTDSTDAIDVDSKVVVRDLEALLQVAMRPFANWNETKFHVGSEWIQVATQTPEVQTFDVWRDRLM